MSQKNRKSLLRTWSIRYFTALVTMGALSASISLGFISLGSATQQRSAMRQLARDVAQMVDQNGGQLPTGVDFALWLVGRSRQHGMREDLNLMIIDDQGHVVAQYLASTRWEQADWPSMLSPFVDAEAPELVSVQLGDQTILAAAEALTDPTSIGRSVILLAPMQHFWNFVSSSDGRYWRYGLLMTVITSGWIVFFWLTRRMTSPISEAVATAKRVASGDYDVRLNTDYSEKELHELMISFQTMADRLKHLESLRTQLIAGVTHEIKTPVTAVNSLLQAIKDGVVSGPDLTEYVDLSLVETERLQSLVNDLLEYSRYKGTAMPIDRRVIDICATVDEIVRRWKQQIQPLSVPIRVTLQKDAQCFSILTDPLRVEQILINLLNNAKEAMITGDVGLIQVNVTHVTDRCNIQVQDSGSGIPTDLQNEIFELFHSKKRGAKRGLGLGLPFSRVIAHSLGGTLTLDWSSPKGTAFTLSLPR